MKEWLNEKDYNGYEAFIVFRDGDFWLEYANYDGCDSIVGWSRMPLSVSQNLGWSRMPLSVSQNRWMKLKRWYRKNSVPMNLRQEVAVGVGEEVPF